MHVTHTPLHTECSRKTTLEASGTCWRDSQRGVISHWNWVINPIDDQYCAVRFNNGATAIIVELDLSYVSFDEVEETVEQLVKTQKIKPME
jgi:hypothetical protein